jgi:urease accessory protein
MLDAMSPSDLVDDLTAFGSPEEGAWHPSDKDLQRAEGSGRIVLSGSKKSTRIIDVFQKAPIRIMFPKVGAAGVEEAVLVNTAGGIAGGDRFEIVVTALGNASIAVTSQAAERVYRALNEPARVSTRLKACDAAKLAWLPQETIVFNCGRLSRETEIELSSGAELLALEWLVLGRAAYGEEMVGGSVTDSWRVKRDGRLIWADCFRATDRVFPQLNRKALLSNCKAVATLVYFGPDLDARLEGLRDIARSLEMPMRCDLCQRAYCRSLCRNGVLRLEARLAQFSSAIEPGARRRPLPGAENVVMLKLSTGWRRP